MKFLNRDASNSITGITKAARNSIIAIVLVLAFLGFCFRTVESGQVGVVTTFGDVSREVQPGITLKLPWPVERLHKIDVRVQKEQVSAAAATKDLQDATASLAVNYMLERGRAGEVYKKIGTEYKERVILPVVQEAFKAATTGYTATELLTQRVIVKEATLSAVQKRLSPQGIIVQDISITNIAFSEAFTKAIEEKQVAQQDAEKAKFAIEREKNQAQAAIEKAKGEAQAAIEAARGQAEAQRLIRENVTPETLQKQAIDRWDGKLPQYLGGGTVFNIPLQGTR